MLKQTMLETLQELLAQSKLSQPRLLEYLSGTNQNLYSIDESAFRHWLRTGRISEEYAKEIERAVAGGNQPFLTRFYQK